jgi:hypothetical protein
VLILVEQHIKAVLSKVFNLKLVDLLLSVNEADFSSGFVVNAEVIEISPWVNRRLSAEPVVLIFEPDIGKGDRSKALILSLLGKRLITEKLLFILLDEGSIENSCLESIVQ